MLKTTQQAIAPVANSRPHSETSQRIALFDVKIEAVLGSVFP